jgi:hypothetical protein
MSAQIGTENVSVGVLLASFPALKLRRAAWTGTRSSLMGPMSALEGLATGDADHGEDGFSPDEPYD